MPGSFGGHIAAFLGYLAAEKFFSRHTVAAYALDLDQFSGFLAVHTGAADPDPAAVDHLTIRLYLGELADRGIQKRSIARKLAAIRSFFRFLVRKKKLASNPSLNVVTPKLPRKLPSFLDEPSVRRMMELPDTSTPNGLRDRAILELLYGTGIRVGELTGLVAGGLDLGGSTVKVLGKGSKDRILPLGGKAREALTRYLALRKDAATGRGASPVFRNSKGSSLNRREVYRIVRKYISLVSEIHTKSPHVLRHTFATHLLNNGADLTAVRELLGHESLATTQLYTHVTVEKLKRIYNQAHPKA